MSQWVDFRVLKQNISIERVLASYRVALQRVGQNQLRGACPLPTHGSERSRQSFSVDTAKNVWTCHSASCCELRQGRVGGNVLDLVGDAGSCAVRHRGGGILRLPPRTSGGLSQRGGFDGSQPFGDAGEDTAGALSTARSDVGWRRSRAASQPAVGRAVGRKGCGRRDRNGERSATRPTVKRGSSTGSADGERCSTSSMR
jgi:hypothetical protein